MHKVIFFISLLMFIGLVYAQDCSEGICPVNSTNAVENSSGAPNNYDEEQEINCSNFLWIQNYIAKQVENGTLNGNQLNIISMIEQANYGLQDELNKLDALNKQYEKELKTKKAYTFLTFGSITVMLALIILRIKERIEKKKYGWTS